MREAILARGIAQGSFVYKMFEPEERMVHGVKEVSKSGRVVRQFGWLYEVMSIDSVNMIMHLKWWSKCLPHGAHEREKAFQLIK